MDEWMDKWVNGFLTSGNKLKIFRLNAVMKYMVKLFACNLLT